MKNYDLACEYRDRANTITINEGETEPDVTKSHHETGHGSFLIIIPNDPDDGLKVKIADLEHEVWKEVK